MPNSVPFTPNGLRYLVLPDPVEAHEETIGAVTISAQADPTKKSNEGTVVAVGDGEVIRRYVAGDYRTDIRVPKYTVGAKLVYGQYSGYSQEFDGTKYLVLAESEILGERILTPFDSLDEFEKIKRSFPL